MELAEIMLVINNLGINALEQAESNLKAIAKLVGSNE